MGVNSVIFANTRAFSEMASMLTAERYQRLIDCDNVAELKKCLIEFSFEGESTDQMFFNALNSVYAYLNEVSPIEPVRLALVKKNDYHNAKVMAKCKYARREIEPSLLYPYGDIDVKKLQDCVLNDEYLLLPLPMAHALSEIDLRFSQGERSGKLIDALLTKAMYEDIFSTLGNGYKEMKAIFQAEVDFANLSVALRVRKNNLTPAVLKTEMIEGGTLSTTAIEKIAFGTEEEIVTALRGAAIAQIALNAFYESEKDAFCDFEKACDDYVLSILRPYRNDGGSYMMFYGFVLARLYELKNVRIIAGGVRAGKGKSEIKEKLRDLYVR